MKDMLINNTMQYIKLLRGKMHGREIYSFKISTRQSSCGKFSAEKFLVAKLPIIAKITYLLYETERTHLAVRYTSSC